MGEYEKAQVSLRKSIPLAGDDARPKSILAWSYARSGRAEEARNLVDELDRLPGPENATHYFRVFGYLALGDMDRTFAVLNQAVEEHWGFLGVVTVITPFDSIRSDPRYTELMTKIGLHPRIADTQGP
jgi:hypothetical protein